MAKLSEDDFYAKWVPLLADNEFQNIDGPRFAALLGDLRDSAVFLPSLNVRQVKGATYPVPYTDSLGTIPAAMRIVGMSAVARNGQTQAQAQANLPAPPVTFQLVANAGGAVQGLVDEQPGTVATVPAAWVQVSGTSQQVIDSFPELVIQNPDGSPHPYNAGDKFRFVFPDGTARLFEVRAYLHQASNPLPTGLNSDPTYAPFAPLVESSVTAAQLAAVATQIPRTPVQNTDYTLATTDFGYIVTFSASTDLNLVLPEHSVAPLALDGAVQIRNLGTGNVFVTFASGVTVISESGGYKVPPKAEAALHHIDLDTWFLNGGRS
ncbi:MAG: hypothetical protein ACRYFX_19695 [Janthinobacterium lividum]